MLDGSGGWSYQITEALSEGTHIFTAVIANDGGGEGTRSQDFVLTVDLTPPGAGNSVAITSYTDDVEPNVGDFGAGTSTNDVAPLLNGTVSGLAAGDVVLIFEGSRLLGQAEVDGAGGWSFQLNDLAQGSHSFRAVIADAAGNRGTGSNQFTLIVDTEPPVSANSVSITSYLDDQAPNTGEYTESTPTNDTSPQLIGTVSGLQAGDVILVFSGTGSGGTLLGQAVTDGSGGWTFQLSGLAQGSHSFTAVITDAAGNRGTASNSFTIVVDLTAPDTGNSVAITGYNDDQAPNVGEFPESTPTNDTSPQLIGTVSGLQAGDVILVFSGTGSGGTLLGQAVTDGSGGWTFQLSGLAQGSHSFTAVIADAAGNRGTASNTFIITVDLTAPTEGNAIGITGYYDDQPPNTGIFSPDVPTNDDTPLLGGTVAGLQPGDMVLIFRGSDTSPGINPLGQAVVVDGEWTFQLSGLSEGDNTFTAVIADASGNRGTSASAIIVLDTMPPTTGNSVAITSYLDDEEPGTGEFGPGTTTNDPTPLLKGTVSGLAAGDVVLVYEGATLLGQAEVSGTTWTFQVAGLDLGAHTFRAVITDSAGNRGTASADFTLTVVNPPPIVGNAVEITSYVDNVEPKVGEFTERVPTNDQTPLLNGVVTGLGALDYILIYQGSTLLSGRAVLDRSGGWFY